MKHTVACCLTLMAVLIAGPATAQSELLSRQNVRKFRATHPCPYTGLVRNACPGWEVALVTPRCAGGIDSPLNMKWYTTADAKAKNDVVWRNCAAPRS